MDKIKLPGNGFFYAIAALAVVGLLSVAGLLVYGLICLFTN